MRKLSILLLFSLSYCSITNVSSSIFPDSFFESVGSGSAKPEIPDFAEENSITIKQTSEEISDTLSITINAKYTNLITELKITGSTFENIISIKTLLAEVSFSTNINLSYNNTYTRENPTYNISVEVISTVDEIITNEETLEITTNKNVTTSYSDETSFTAKIKSVQDITVTIPSATVPETWNNNDMFCLTVSDKGATLSSIAPSVSLTGSGTFSITPQTTDTISVPMSSIILVHEVDKNLIDSSLKISVYSTVDDPTTFTAFSMSDAKIKGSSQ